MPDHKLQIIDKFFGQVTDRDASQLDKGEFYLMQNIRNWYTEYIKKRDGSKKWFSETHNNSAAMVIGMFQFFNDSGVRTYIKILADGTLWKHADGSGTWTQITTGAPTFANADTWFAQLKTQKTGAGADATGTLTTSDSISITDTVATLTVNAHVNKILSVADGEKKLVSGNIATKVYVKERFDDSPTGTYNIYPRQFELFIANGTNFYKCDLTTCTRLDNTSFAGFAFTGIVTHGQRLFGWIGNRLFYSDAGVGEQFSRNAWRDFRANIQVAKPINGVLFIYEETRITAQEGDSPDNYQWTDFLDIGTTAPKSVDNYLKMQFFLNNQYGVCMITVGGKILPFARIEPLSVSRNFIGGEILSHTAAQMAAAVGKVHLGKYYLWIGTDTYVLHIEESLKAGLDPEGNIRWVWTYYSYPVAINANCAEHFNTQFVVGSQTTGQVYEIEVGNQNSDDGTDIAMILEKRDWVVTEAGNDKGFHALHIIQAQTGSAVTMNWYFATMNTYTYQGSADVTVDLSTVTDWSQTIVIPGNITIRQNKGSRISFKVTESGSNGGSSIQQIALLFDNDILY